MGSFAQHDRHREDDLRRRPKPHRYQLRDARFLHGHAIKYRGDADRLLAVRNEHELRLYAHLFHQLGETADISFVEGRVDLVENAEWTRLILDRKSTRLNSS